MSTIFRPWIGKNFGNSELGKLLILGDSHYDYGVETEAAGHTIEVVGNDRWVQARFFKNVARLFSKTDFTELRNDVAFANAIQHFMHTPTQKPNTAQLDSAEGAIREYLGTTGATRMVVFSSRVWERLFNKPKDWGRYVETIDANGQKATVWELQNGSTVCYALGLPHPSAIGWSKEKWHPVLKAFLTKY